MSQIYRTADMPTPDEAAVRRFAGHVATLGRGPGRSRPLSRIEARDALGLVLDGAVHPAQVGAFLMLLRYRGEDAEEITGLVEAARDALPAERAALAGHVDLDWPSYGAGRTRGAPWFLLSALALAQTGVRVLMHGSNAFTGGLEVADGLQALGLSSCTSLSDAAAALRHHNFAYVPVAALSPALDGLLAMRTLFGLRSPINTVARLIDPADAGVSVDGVFHPAYIAVHLAVAERLDRRSLVVVKGGGGEAERPPGKPVAAHLWRRDGGRDEVMLPALATVGERTPHDPSPEALGLALRRHWQGDGAPDPVAVQTVIGTIALALLALGTSDPEQADRRAAEIWHARRMDPVPRIARATRTDETETSRP